MKQFLFIIVFLQMFLLCHAQEDKKWSFGVGGGIYQAPIMKGDAIRDNYFDLNYLAGLNTQYRFGKKSRHALSIGLNYKESKNRFTFSTTYYPQVGEPVPEEIWIKSYRKYLILNTDYKYFFQKNKTSLFVGFGFDAATFVMKVYRPEYKTKVLKLNNYFIDDYTYNNYLCPYFLLGNESILAKKLKIQIQFMLNFQSIIYTSFKDNSILIDFRPEYFSPNYLFTKGSLLQSGFKLSLYL